MTYCLIVDQDQHMMLSDRDSRLCGPMKGDPASTQTPLVPVHMGVPVSHMTHCPCCGDRLSKTRPSQLRALNGAESQQDQTMSEGEAHGGRTTAVGASGCALGQCATYSPSLARMPLTGHRMPQNRLAARGA